MAREGAGTILVFGNMVSLNRCLIDQERLQEVKRSVEQRHVEADKDGMPFEQF
jgi:hypothetical protein